MKEQLRDIISQGLIEGMKLIDIIKEMEQEELQTLNTLTETEKAELYKESAKQTIQAFAYNYLTEEEQETICQYCFEIIADC